MEMTMNEDHDRALIELGAATTLTLGEPELEAYENVTMKDFKD